MPRIFDNIDLKLQPALAETLKVADHADFCVGYFNLRGWKQIDSFVDRWPGGDGNCCRLLVGMQRLPEEELRAAMSITEESGIDNQTALQIKKKLAQSFRDQLTFGVPTDDDEAGLRHLARQIKDGKVVVKLYLRHTLHAKLYLLFRPDPVNPIVGYLGSSNLTFAGLSKQGELNVDVMDHDATQKLAKWFEDRWTDRWCIDISNELVEIIETSWARPNQLSPYHIYLKMAYHLAREARDGLNEFRIPSDFGNRLLDFQIAAVKIAAHHLNKRGGVLIGDVVGLGKTLMATALARIFEDDHDLETLILCPKNLVKMWEDYVHRYRLRAKVVSVSRATQALPDMRRYRLMLIDESHNLRNRQGKRYRAIQEYIRKNESKCILLTATPYNKTYLDLSNQLRLFVDEHDPIGIRPERLIREKTEMELLRQQIPVRSLAAFEKSEYSDDWRDLMRLYLVRRTRSFIQNNYAETDPDSGRRFLTFEDGSRSYFPERIPQTVKFSIRDGDPNDQYARLYEDKIVRLINKLHLPRYGMGNYVEPSPHAPPAPAEARQIEDLSRAGKRLMGFCRTNLFKRLESSGEAFIISVERHIVRNYVYLHALRNHLPIPFGKQDVGLLDNRVTDEDEAEGGLFDDDNGNEGSPPITRLETATDFQARAAEVYADYEQHYHSRFKWLRPDLFIDDLAKDLEADCKALIKLLKHCGQWDPTRDEKLNALAKLLSEHHPGEKVLVFSQFADTVRYLERELQSRGIDSLAGVTGDNENPTALAWRFSPESNEKRIAPADELRILTATDVLSEGQNLQDCAIVVNYDLPWAIIRLIQRVGRVDRLGQKADRILCYTFLPADGVERIIRLRSRVRQRLRENAEVVGTDEAFFEDDGNEDTILDLYNEKAGILDGDADTEVDLASYAYQIWKNATEADPSLLKTIPELPSVVYSTKPHQPAIGKPEGALVYVKTGEGADALAWVDNDGKSVTQSQYDILRAAECAPDTPAPPRLANHHDLVCKGAVHIMEEEKSIGGQLGRPSGARFRTYERLKAYAQGLQGTLFASGELTRVIEDIYRYPLRSTATDTLNRQLRADISDADLAQLVIALRDEGRLCVVHEEEQTHEPQIICSLGLSAAEESPDWFRPQPKPQPNLFGQTGPDGKDAKE